MASEGTKDDFDESFLYLISFISVLDDSLTLYCFAVSLSVPIFHSNVGKISCLVY